MQMDLAQRLMRISKGNPSLFLVLLLFASWAFLLSILAASQLVNGPLGLNIHPTGEDRVWTDLLDKGGFTTHRSWWALASRNPLAPWWYDATTIVSSVMPNGLYLSKRVVELFIAIFSSLLVFELLDRKRVAQCYMLGLLVLVWNFSGYIEQILFVMLIALVFSLLSIYTYIRYLKSNRATNEWLLLSLASYFVALGTYTIQCGIPLAILLLSLAYGRKALATGSKLNVWKRSWYDASYFGAVFVLFSMVWMTTSGPTSSYFKVNAKLIAQNSWSSIANLLWHQDTVDLTRSMLQFWSLGFVAVVFVTTVIVCMLLVRWVSGQEQKHEVAKSSFPVEWNPTILLFAIAFSLAVPTFALEAMSTIWYPGSRSRMIQQAFQPILYFSVAFALFVSGRRLLKSPVTFHTSMATLVAFGVVIGLEYNRKLTELSSYERNLVAGLKTLVPEVVRPTRFVVKLENDDWYGGRNAELNRILMKQSFGSDLVSLDAIFRGPADVSVCLKIGDDSTGVYCPSAKSFLPYSDILFASFDGKRVSLLSEVNEATFAGYQAVYQREQQVQTNRLVSMRPRENKVEFGFDSKPPGTGWSVPEVSSTGETFVWMSNTIANFEFYRFADRKMRVRFKILQPISVEIRDSLQISIEGNKIPLEIVDKSDEKWVFTAELPVASKDEIAILRFHVSSTVVPAGSDRQLAVPFDWIEIVQESSSTGIVESNSPQPVDL